MKSTSGSYPIGLGVSFPLTINRRVTCDELHVLAKVSEALMLCLTDVPGSGKREQRDSNGNVVLVYGNCPICDSTIAVKVSR